jgi:hypothetical protein
MKPNCDCLNFCGDDPHIDKGLVRPCLTFQQETARKRLYAAAPDMLEALKTLQSMAATFPNELHKDHPDVVAARAAIARATGDNQ